MRPVSIQSLFVVVACTLAAAVGAANAGATESKPEWAIKKGGEAKKVLKAEEVELLPSTISTKKRWVIKQIEGIGIAVECGKVSFEGGAGASEIFGPKGIATSPLHFEE